MTYAKRFFVLGALVITAVQPAPVAAQSRFELGPLVAFYRPAGTFRSAPYYDVVLPNSPRDLAGFAWGAQGRLWLSSRTGVQLQVAQACSNVGGGNTPAGPYPPRQARVLTLSVQGLYNVLPTPLGEGSRLWLSAGFGLVRHGGSAYARYGSPAQLASVVGLGYAKPIARRLTATLGLSTSLYYIDVSDNNGTSIEHGFQADGLLHAGLIWTGF